MAVEIRILADTPRELGMVEGMLEIGLSEAKIAFMKDWADMDNPIPRGQDGKYMQTLRVPALPARRKEGGK